MKTPYDRIIEIILQVCRSDAYDDYLVTIKLDDIITTEVIFYIDEIKTFIWENDWYKGQKNVTLLGFSKMSVISLSNYSRIILKDGVPNE